MELQNTIRPAAKKVRLAQSDVVLRGQARPRPVRLTEMLEQEQQVMNAAKSTALVARGIVTNI